MISSPITFIENVDELQEIVSFLDDTIIKNGIPVVKPASFYQTLPVSAVKVFCHNHGIYQLITEELVTFLKALVGERRAIEVACGYGTLGRTLNIPFSDLRVQERAEIKLLYEMTGQPVIRYPKDVAKKDAIKAVRDHKPDVALACWITEPVSINGQPKNVLGPDEHKILSKVKNYAVMGNLQTHGDKAIRSKPHYLIKADWLVTRSMYTEDNCMMIWGELPPAIHELDLRFDIQFIEGL